MRRDPATGNPDLFSYARDYLHVYMPRVRACHPRRSRPTGSAWNASWATSPRPSTFNASTSPSTTSTAPTSKHGWPG